MDVTKRSNWLAAVLVAGVLAATGCAAQEAADLGHPDTYSAEPIEGWVVDADTNEPLEGVVVVAAWILDGWTTPFIKFDRVGTLELMESVTGSDGRFNFPAWGPLRRPRGGMLWAQDPELLFFKSGYDIEILSNPLTSKIPTNSVRTSRWNGKTIKLKKFEGDVREYASRVRSFGIGGLGEALKDCTWRKIPKTIIAMRKEDLWLRERGQAGVFWQSTVPREGSEDPCGARAFWEKADD